MTRSGQAATDLLAQTERIPPRSDQPHRGEAATKFLLPPGEAGRRPDEGDSTRRENLRTLRKP